jgi:ribosomal-protein-alanine N-acetyltransferase
MQSKPVSALPDGDRIIPMRRSDLAAVHQLECACQTDPWSLQHFADELDHPFAAIDLYWQREQLAGFLCTWLIAGELQIQNLVTHAAFRRKGIAARLLEHVITRSRSAGLTSVWLEVRISNTPAITLYERFGLIACDRRKGYYPDGEDAMIMSYSVSPEP